MLGRIDLGKYNKSIPKDVKIYGIRRLINQLSPEWERTDDAIGLYAEATHDGGEVRNDFDNLYPWSDIISYNYDTSTKKETAKFGDPTFKFDGTNGEVLTRIPKFWWKRWRDGTYEYIQIADNEVDGFTKSDAFSISRYPMSGSSSDVHSKNGEIPLGGLSITELRDCARSLGDDFGQLDWRYFIIQLLYLVEYASYYSRNVLGYGYTYVFEKAISGGCDSLGMKSGCLANSTDTQIIYRGIEDIFGNVWQFIDGLSYLSYSNYKGIYVCYDPSKYVTESTGAGYEKITYSIPSTSGYIRSLGYSFEDPLMQFPANVSDANYDSYIANYYEYNNSSCVAVGGYYHSSSQAGLWSYQITGEKGKLSGALYYGARIIRYK